MGRISLTPRRSTPPIQRLVLSTSLPVFIPELAVPSTDGISTVYTCKITGPLGGVMINAQATLKLPNKPQGFAALHQSQPRGDYCFLWTGDVIEMWNNMFRSLWPQVRAAQSSIKTTHRSSNSPRLVQTPDA